MIKASVIGAGWYAADSHIPTLAAQRDVVLDGVCRLGAAELARVRDAFGFAFASEDHRAVLDRRPDIVVVASPHGLHYRHALDALEAGAHVLCEKPMTVDPREAWHLVERARALGRHLLIANGYNYLPYLQGVRRDLAAGRIGRIEHVQCSFFSGTRRVFDGEQGLDRWTRTFFRPDPSTWQDPAQGGGFPSSWHGGLFYSDYNRKSVRFAPIAASTGKPGVSVAFAQSLPGGPVAMRLGPDGALYLVEYGGWFQATTNDAITRIAFTRR